MQLSERDYFGDLPIVLSVSRLAQPLDETPAAVTIIDCDATRQIGRRHELGGYNQFLPDRIFNRRTFVTLRLEG